jgi:hypothetical protein
VPSNPWADGTRTGSCASIGQRLNYQPPRRSNQDFAPQSGRRRANRLRRFIRHKDCRAANHVVNRVFQFRAPHFQLFNFLVRREIDFLLNTTNFVIQPVVFVEEMTEVIVRTFETPNRFAMFREFAIDGMMQVHWFTSPF